jgi:hypothetical protein
MGVLSQMAAVEERVVPSAVRPQAPTPSPVAEAALAATDWLRRCLLRMLMRGEQPTRHPLPDHIRFTPNQKVRILNVDQ